ncbi:I78 family peptidase inhibitor [Sphingomonas sp.]|uniref:I78 family peptidase inhibitor n=1 Tax=Sphingomonas sp. TaxID=28214 RepID=UPI002B9B0F7C|nr:I78 family peptidase inhibitor [Sphingomonas sp.]HTG37851.1 I78 family peptidase inhibitor [Sphingomonas sp.]
MIRILPVALLACSACAPMNEPQSPANDPAETGAQCDATAIQDLVGQNGDPATIERAKSMSGARDVRRYVSGSALTMDFRPDRLNVEVDAAGRIVKLGCG